MTKIALIGYGYWGPNLARNLAMLPGSPLCGIADTRADLLSTIQATYPGLAVSRDARSFLEDPTVDGVVLATPAHTHGPLAREALSAGKSVLVEKPLAMSVAEARELIQLAEQSGRVLMAGHTFLFSPPVIKLRELIASGQLGRILYLHGARLNLGRVRTDVDVLWNLGPHDVSILLYLLGAMPESVSAVGYAYLRRDIADVAFLDFRFPDDVSAHVHLSWLDPCKVRRMTVVGVEKMVVYDDTDVDRQIAVFDTGILDRDEMVRERLPFASYHEFQLTRRTSDIYVPKIGTEEPLRNVCAHFVACVEEREKCLSDGKFGLQVTQVLEAAQNSMRHNGQREAIARSTLLTGSEA